MTPRKALGVLALLAFLAWAPIVHAQNSVEVAPGYTAREAVLLPSAGGTTDLLLLSQPDSAPEAASLVEWLHLDHDGAVVSRLPIDIAARSTTGFSLQAARLGNGEVALFAPSPFKASGARTMLAGLLRLSAEGRVLHTAALGHPSFADETYRKSPDSVLYANAVVPAPDGTLALVGVYGSDPYVPWWAHCTSDGTLIADGDELRPMPGPGVTGASFDADGSLRIVTESSQRAQGQFDTVLHVYSPRGSLKEQPILAERGGELTVSAFTAQELALIVREPKPAISFFTRTGQLLRSTPWTDPIPQRIIADGDGLAALESADGKRNQILRIDSTGKIAWRSAPGLFLALARAPDGELRVLELLTDAKGSHARLRRLPAIR